jgi:hypothetical protein
MSVIVRPSVSYWTDDEGKPRTTKRILADACGPDLRWATAVVEKVASTGTAVGGSGGFQEEPF